MSEKREITETIAMETENGGLYFATPDGNDLEVKSSDDKGTHGYVYDPSPDTRFATRY